MDKERRRFDDDDGHTIADMNVDGMPWYRPRHGSAPRSSGNSTEPMDFRQRLSAYGGILAAVGVVSVAFGGLYFLAILLMDLVW